jgi:hypothetical protein
MSVLRIKTKAGNECWIDSEDLKHYREAEVLEEVDTYKEIEDAVSEEGGEAE